MTTDQIDRSSPEPTPHNGATIGTCALGHIAQTNNCRSCQRVLALRLASQLNAAALANARRNAQVH
jgi:hypothetical protein